MLVRVLVCEYARVRTDRELTLLTRCVDDTSSERAREFRVRDGRKERVARAIRVGGIRGTRARAALGDFGGATLPVRVLAGRSRLL